MATLIYVLPQGEPGPEQELKTYVEFMTQDPFDLGDLERLRRIAKPKRFFDLTPRKEPETATRLTAEFLALAFDETDLEPVRAKAEAGDVWSQLEMGMTFHAGRGRISADGSRAIKWYRAAAANGSAAANYNLGYLNFRGELIPTNLLEAEKNYILAAKGGIWQAEANLASMYLRHHHYFPDKYEDAAKLYMSLVEKNFVFALNNLGHLYFTGKGVPRDFVRAYMWFELSRVRQISGGVAPYDMESINLNILLTKFRLTPEEELEGQRLATEWWEAHKED